MAKKSKKRDTKSIKKINADVLENMLYEDHSSIANVDIDGVNVTIKRTLSLREMLEFVSTVVETCFSEENGEYMPEIRNFAIRCATIELYSNLSLPNDTELTYDIVYNTNVFDVIVNTIDDRQFNEMIQAAKKKINHRANSNIETLMKQMNEVATGFEQVEENLSKLFSGIDSKTVSTLTNALIGGKFDEDRLVSAVLAKRASTEKAVV